MQKSQRLCWIEKAEFSSFVKQFKVLESCFWVTILASNLQKCIMQRCERYRTVYWSLKNLSHIAAFANCVFFPCHLCKLRFFSLSLIKKNNSPNQRLTFVNNKSSRNLTFHFLLKMFPLENDLSTCCSKTRWKYGELLVSVHLWASSTNIFQDQDLWLHHVREKPLKRPLICWSFRVYSVSYLIFTLSLN